LGIIKKINKKRRNTMNKQFKLVGEQIIGFDKKKVEELSHCVFQNGQSQGYTACVTSYLLAGEKVNCETQMGLRVSLIGRTPEMLSLMGVSVEEYREWVKTTLEDQPHLAETRFPYI
jgi:ABC-type uncharacterized transport system permease subunit